MYAKKQKQKTVHVLLLSLIKAFFYNMFDKEKLLTIKLTIIRNVLLLNRYPTITSLNLVTLRELFKIRNLKKTFNTFSKPQLAPTTPQKFLYIVFCKFENLQEEPKTRRIFTSVKS